MRTNNQKQEQYINEVFAHEDPHLRAIRSALKAAGLEGINVGPYEGKTLQVLIQMIGAKKVVEVGTLYGYSTLWMGRALPLDGKLISLEVSSKNFHAASQFLADTEVRDRVEVRNGDARELLKELSPEGPFDMIFIDADKASYPTYLDWAEKNIRKGGLIVGDNTFLFGHLTGEPRDQDVGEAQIAAMKEFNQRLADTSKYTSVIIPTFEGMTVAVKK